MRPDLFIISDTLRCTTSIKDTLRDSQHSTKSHYYCYCHKHLQCTQGHIKVSVSIIYVKNVDLKNKRRLKRFL